MIYEFYSFQPPSQDFKLLSNFSSLSQGTLNNISLPVETNVTDKFEVAAGMCEQCRNALYFYQ